MKLAAHQSVTTPTGPFNCRQPSVFECGTVAVPLAGFVAHGAAGA